MAAQTHLGRRAQWNLAADALALRFLDAGRQLGDANRGPRGWRSTCCAPELAADVVGE